MSDNEVEKTEITEEETPTENQNDTIPVTKKKRTITPEQREKLLKRLEKAREVKKQAMKTLGKVPRKTQPIKYRNQEGNKCDICGKVYATSKSLKAHMRNIHKEKSLSTVIKEKNNEKELKENEKTELKEENQKQTEAIKENNEKQEIQKNTYEEVIDNNLENKIIPTPPPAPPKLERTPPVNKVIEPEEPRYTIKEFQRMHAAASTRRKQQEEQKKKQENEARVQKAIDNMLRGGF
jgi:hypothetical protein